ncbi:hypothetical protein [Sulfuracidifex tepidarius]|uniref:Uncharacterized protein n=1 Tax=Sulfuracidifex tepidarius TaxID=1294262 RepID=A0A510DTV2_9CREN|nr:hypothetical protein [Sulfuracidifex tepidarius]BBG23631.1 hypothetical protein IC006_0919 [Sulfuracidifex tepidarius]BBG26378.1 hypothetical protein IC007_0886 [Sulfuracidifex tepidarius]
MSISITANTKYVYVSTDKRVRIILVDVDEYGVIKISGDVESNSRPGQYHHTEILINGNWIRFSCSCEAGAYGPSGPGFKSRLEPYFNDL